MKAHTSYGGILLLSLSGLLVAIGVYNVIVARRLSVSRQAEGRVTEITQDSVDNEDGSTGTIYDATYEFTLPNGTVITGGANYSGSVGDKVTVFYNPNDPHENRLAEDSQTSVRGSLGGLLVMLACAGILGWGGLSQICPKAAPAPDSSRHY